MNNTNANRVKIRQLYKQRKAKGTNPNMKEAIYSIIGKIPTEHLNITGIMAYPEVHEIYPDTVEFEAKRDKLKHILDWERRKRNNPDVLKSKQFKKLYKARASSMDGQSSHNLSVTSDLQQLTPEQFKYDTVAIRVGSEVAG